MSEALRKAARRMLAQTAGPEAAGAEVERAVFDVTIGERTEMVTVRLKGDSLLCTTSDGRHDGPFVIAVLRALAGEGGPAAGEAKGAEDEAPEHPAGARGESLERAEARGARLAAEQLETPPRITVRSDGGGRITLPPGATRTVEASDQPASADRASLARALDDVVTAVVRLGAREADGSPSVEETIERLVRAAPVPLPTGIGRWVGRLREALGHRDVDTLARILDGAARVAEDLSEGEPDGEGLQRIVSWLGATGDAAGDVETLYDRVLIEVAREWLQGVERPGIERRYLVDASSGEVFREERLRGAGGASVGPCPRVVSVGLAEVERGARPRRIRLLQYAVTPEIGDDDWSKLAGIAMRELRPLAGEYRRALDAFPGLAEPFALVAPSEWENGTAPVPIDAGGDPLPLARAEDPAGFEALERHTAGERPEWIAGRLVDADGRLMLLPCSAAFRREGETTLLRLR